MSLSAPLAVAVEVRAGGRRVFRLSDRVAESGVTLERPAPFDIGRPVTIAFTLPDADGMTAVAVRAVLELTEDDGEGVDGGRQLTFTDPPREARAIIARYVAGRLGLPKGTPWL